MRTNRTFLYCPACISNLFLSLTSLRGWRNGPRALAMAGALLGVLFAAGNAHAAVTTYTVNATTDTGAGTGTTGDLRYALTQAEQAANSGSIIDITATGTITLTSALPDITQDTTITGPGANQLTISGANAYQVLSITAGTVAISGVTIANGKTASDGGAIANAGTLKISDSTLSGNSALHGGGIANSGTLTVSAVTFLNNVASGGGIYSSAGTVNVTNSTFAANSATDQGAGISNAAGIFVVASSTFWGNSAPTGGGIENHGTLTLTNSILAESAGTSDTGVHNTGTISKEENNLFYGNVGGDANLTLSATDVTGQDPKLLPLGNYGGSTLSLLPQPGSPAVCASSVLDAKDASGATLTTDQRGFPLNAANCSNGGVDAGAVQTNYLMVTTATDSAPSSCTSAACSLRDAITAANTAGGDIAFKSSLTGTLTISPTQGALPAITGAVNIIGPGANQLTVSGGGSTTVGSVITVNSGAVATLYGLTIANGNVNGDGGGIHNSGTLAVIDSAVSGNTANNGNIGGGGIYTTGTLTLRDSTVSGNTAQGSSAIQILGGGIASSGITIVTNSTISGNAEVAPSSGTPCLGGGIENDGTLGVTNSTISNNTGNGPCAGGGISVDGGSASLANSIVAGNTSGLLADVNGTYTDKGGNLVGTSGINLAIMGSYGGLTQTMLPLPGSPALCVGSSSLALDANGNALRTDQRGVAFGAGGYCASGKVDAGAVQTDYTSAQFTNSGFNALVNQVVTPAPILSVTENGQNTGGIPITLTFTGSGTATGLGPTSTVAGTGATFSSIKVDTAGAADTLSVSLPVGTSNLTASGALEIDGPVTLSPATGALTGSSVGASYSQAVTASGGKSPYTYALGTGAFPDGVTLNTSTGVLSGTPTKAGNFTFSIQATDKRSTTGSASYTLAISQAATLITVTSKDTTTTSEPSGASFVGDSVTFTASLTPVGKGVTFAKGVAFTLDGTAVAACSSQAVTVAADGSSATATCVITTLTKGPHTMVASYPTGDANYGLGTSSNFTQTVSLAGTSVVVTSSANPSTVDNSVTFTATVTNSGTGGVPTDGTVEFKSDGSDISGCGAVSVVAGTGNAKATCAINTLTAVSSPHSIVAVYSGDTTSFSGSTSTALSQAVSKATPTVAVTTSGSTGVNQQATLTASVTPLGPVALSSTGTMTFKDGGTTISGCSGVAVNTSTGQATCSTTFTGATSHTITASYTGDANYSAATSTNTTVTVSKASTSVAITSLDTTTGVSGGTSNLNDSVAFTAVVTPYNGTTALTPPFTGAATLTGSVNFTSNGKTVCSSSVGIDGTTGQYEATCTTATLPAGSATVVATYAGDANYSGSNNNLTQNVGTATTTTSVVSSLPASTVNQSVTFTASVTPFTGATKLAGVVTFTSLNTGTGATATICNAVPITASTGQAQCQAASLTPGAYTVTASYGSDSNYSGSSGTVSQTVGQATTSIGLTSSPNPSTINQQVTLTATVTAPAGVTSLNGTVSFTDNGTAISGCPTGPINPNNPVVVCTTTGLALGTHSLVASYGGDTNFSNSSSTAVSQTVNAAPTTSGITTSASGNTATVNQQVSFTATVKGAAGAIQFSGAMSFTDNGAPISGCSNIAVGTTTGAAVCITSSLLKGAHTIAASYAGDNNFSASNSSLSLTVNPAASSTALVSSLDPSVALNPNNYNDVVALTATVSPASGVPLSGAVTFTSNGAPIAECQAAVPVNPSTGTATCSTSSLGFGAHTILAAYNGDPNYSSSSNSITQSVQDYTLDASPTSTVTVSQRFTNTTDPFTSQAITVAAMPIAGFTGQLSLTCNVVPLSAPTGAVAPLCALGSSTLSITASGSPQPVAVTIDAGTGSTPVATPGTYNVSITGVDATTGLVRSTASFVVNVRYQAPPLTIVSGATTGNTSSVQFTLPPNVGITTMLCASVTGPTLTSSVAPVALAMSCTFNPSTIAPASTTQNVLVAVTVATGGTTTARLRDDRTTIVMAGLAGVPLLLLLGLMPGGKSSRKLLLRFMAIVFAVVMVMQATGCGGGSFTAPPSTSGQTPPGSYNILVQGTGTDGQVYQAVMQVNVTR